MNPQYSRAPHVVRPTLTAEVAHAALLIDFDNVTMGIRSDLSKELKSLLNSDIIKGKVAVQRAYADWRRYPQYIVPLAEASVDLIYAPAYGSQKKNATDIRLAIDALELVFTRPEIGTFILLSGDSDFSSLVLKLKEYAKYVIGVGIRESASDLLVQNCDEYYSYSALTGLKRTTEDSIGPKYDPWELVEVALQRMVADGDVMRSDRLKQVLVRLDPTFDEKALGFSKYNRFLQEAAKRGAVALHKLENGQYEVGRADVDASAEPSDSHTPSKDNGKRRGRRGRGGRNGEERAADGKVVADSASGEAGAASGAPPADLATAFDLLKRAIADLTKDGGNGARDSDVKRRMLELEPNWDESTFGFGKFSRFLRRAHDDRAVELVRTESGIFEVSLLDDAGADGAAAAGGSAGDQEPAEKGKAGKGSRSRGRGGRTRAKAGDGGAPAFDVAALGLPATEEAVVNYLANRYKGVGKKSGQLLVDAFGADKVFAVLATDPDRVLDVLGSARSKRLMEGWTVDLEQRKLDGKTSSEGTAASVASTSSGKPRSGRSRRGGRGRKKATPKT